MFDARRFDKRITIEQRSEARTGSGAVSVAWTAFLVAYASSLYQGGREFTAAAQVHGAVDAVFVMRNVPGITNRMRVNFEGRLFDIIAVDNLSDRCFVRLICRDGQRQGS